MQYSTTQRNNKDGKKVAFSTRNTRNHRSGDPYQIQDDLSFDKIANINQTTLQAVSDDRDELEEYINQILAVLPKSPNKTPDADTEAYA